MGIQRCHLRGRLVLSDFKIPEGLDTRPVAGFEHYRVSSDGRVWTRQRQGSPGGELKAQIRPDGYEMVLLRSPGQKKVGRTVHRMVAEAFIGPCPEGQEVRHLDGSRSNNHVENLAYGTRSDNMQDAHGHGTLSRGETHPSAKLTESDVRQIRARRSAGERLASIASDFDVNPSHASAICLGKRWKHVR